MFKPTAAAALIVTLLLGSLFSATAGDRIDIKELPKAVLTGIQMRFPDAEILSAERDTDDGRIEYEVKIRHKGQRYEVSSRKTAGLPTSTEKTTEPSIPRKCFWTIFSARQGVMNHTPVLADEYDEHRPSAASDTWVRETGFLVF